MRYVGIDPSTTTGLVILEGEGNVLQARDVKGLGNIDPRRLGTLVDQIINAVHPGDVVCIEGFSYGSQGRGVSVQYGLGYMLRDRLYRHSVAYIEVSPAQLKKFISGKGNTAKPGLVQPLLETWGFEHKSDNVRDAYGLAKIAEAIDAADRDEPLMLTDYQAEVIEAIRNPQPKKKPNKTTTRRGKPRAAVSHTQN